MTLSPLEEARRRLQLPLPSGTIVEDSRGQWEREDPRIKDGWARWFNSRGSYLHWDDGHALHMIEQGRFRLVFLPQTEIGVNRDQYGDGESAR